MAYVQEQQTGLVPWGAPAPLAQAPSAEDPIVGILKTLAPWALLALVVYLLWRYEKKAARANPKQRRNHRWRSLPEWEGNLPAEERHDILKRQIGQDGYTKTLKRIVALGNLTGNKSAQADAAWLQREFAAR